MNINGVSLRSFRKEFAETVKELEEKHGIKIQLGNITYESDSFRCKMMAKNNVNPTKKSNVVKKTPEELVGESVVMKGTKFKIVDYKVTNRKYPYIIENARGTRYKTSYEQVVKNIC